MTTSKIYKAFGPFEVHSPEWHAHRRQAIGASEVAAILGVEGAYGTPLEIWADKTGKLPADDGEDKEWLHFGQVLEPIIAKEFEAKAKLKTLDEDRQFISVEWPWLGCSLDRWFLNAQRPKEESGPLELKNTGSFMRKRWLDGVWLPYQVQVQAQMAVTGAEQAAVAVLIGGNEFKWAMVDRNQRFIDAMLEKLYKFWMMVEQDVMPDPTGPDTKLIGTLLGKEDAGTSVALTGTWIDLDEELEQVKKEMKKLKARKDELEAKLKKHIGKAERGVLPGGGQYTYKMQSQDAYTVPARETRVLRRIK
jgi:putative phage-type endonuclease